MMQVYFLDGGEGFCQLVLATARVSNGRYYMCLLCDGCRGIFFFRSSKRAVAIHSTRGTCFFMHIHTRTQKQRGRMAHRLTPTFKCMHLQTLARTRKCTRTLTHERIQIRMHAHTRWRLERLFLMHMYIYV